MAMRTEVSAFRLHLKTPGTDRLRKSAAGELRHLMATGWHETGRRMSHHHVTVRMERTTPIIPGLTSGDGSPRRQAR